MVVSGQADIGIIPSFELTRHEYAVVPGVGIAARGAVRSILLVSRCPAESIRTLAADTSSRTSVALARVLLARKFGVRPEIVARPPDLDTMLEGMDAALIIGDPALRIDPDKLPYHVYDLAREWTGLTGLPMVFAVWAGRKEVIDPSVIRVFQDSEQYGRRHLAEIVAAESAGRGFPVETVRAYLNCHIVTRLGAAEEQGMALFLRYARELEIP
jgi:predicted solute-binding protein